MTVPQRYAAKCKRAVSAAGKYLSTHTLYLSTMIPFSCFIVVVIMGIMVWYTSVVSRHLEQSVFTNAIHQTEISSDSLRIAFQDYSNLSAKLSLLSPLSPRFYQGSNEAYQALKNYNLSSFKFSNLAIYYPHESTVITTEGSCQFNVLFHGISQLDTLEELLCSDTGTVVTSTFRYGESIKSAKILFIQPLSSRHKSIYILETPMLNRLFFSTDENSGSIRFLYDGKGDLLWASAEVDDGLLFRLHQFAADTSSGIRMTDQTGNWIWSRSEVSYGVMLAEMTPVRNQFYPIQTVMKALATLCVLLLATGIGIMVFSHKHSLAPVQNMLQSFQDIDHFRAAEGGDAQMLREIRSEYSRLLNENKQTVALLSSNHLRNLLVLRILCGRYADTGELKNICRWLNISFPYDGFFACIFLFDHVLSEQEYLKFQSIISQQENSDCVIYFCLSPDERNVVAIVNVCQMNFDRNTWGEHMIATCLPRYDITLGIGKTYGTITSLGRSYIEAHTAIDYRLIKGTNTYICYDAVTESGGTDSSYPQQQLNKYVEALQAWDVKQISASLDELVQYVGQHALSLQQVKCICFDLTSAFLRQAHSLGALSDQLSSILDVFSIAEYSSIRELVEKIQKNSLLIRNHITDYTETADARLVQRITEYLQQNIANSQFSLSELADYTGISIQTIRRKFKDVTGQTLNNYFIHLRVDRARMLLITTDLPLQTVCDQCGYMDVSSFIRLFKTETGISPGKLRESIKGADQIQNLKG